MKKQPKKQVNTGTHFLLVEETSTRVGELFDGVVNFFSRFLITFLLSFGSVVTFALMMDVTFVRPVIYVVLGVLSLIFTLFYKKFAKKWLVLLLSSALVAVGFLAFLRAGILGAQIIYTDSINSIYAAMVWTAPPPLVEWDASYIFATTYVLALFSVVITALAAFFVTARLNFIGVFLCTFPLFQIGAMFGVVPPYLPFSFMLAGWAGALVLHISNRQRTVARQKSEKKKSKQRRFAYKNHTARFGGSALVMTVALLLIFSISGALLTAGGFGRGENLDALRHDVREGIMNAYDLITGFDRDASLKDGRLYVLGDRRVRGRRYMTVTVPSDAGDVYLAGFVGAVYTGRTFEPFPAEQFHTIREFEQYLQARGASLPTLRGDALVTYENADDLHSGEFNIANFRREKEFMYAAYGMRTGHGMEPVNDRHMTPERRSEYRYDAFYNPLDIARVPNTILFRTPSFRPLWESYVAFVRENYLGLPSADLSAVYIAREINRQVRGDTIFELVDGVRAYFADNLELSNNVARLPRGEEFFTSFFLDNQRQGHSAHFAAAGTLVMRALGVPARYVEGFRVSAEEVADADVGANNSRILTLTDGHSHAWIEIFDSYYGWIPVEMTNGFWDVSMVDFMNQARQLAAEGAPSEDEQEQEDERAPEDGVAEDPDADRGVMVEDNEEDEQEESRRWWLWLLLALPALLILALILSVAFLVIRRIIVLAKRAKVFDGSDYKRQVILGVSLLQKMLKYQDVCADDTYSYTGLCEKIQQTDVWLARERDPEILEKIFEIYEKAQFSKIYVDEDMARLSLDFIDEFGVDLYKRQSFVRRLRLRYIDNLM